MQAINDIATAIRMEKITICHAFFLPLARNSTRDTLSVLPTSPKLKSDAKPKYAQKCVYACSKPVVDIIAGMKRVNLHIC